MTKPDEATFEDHVKMRRYRDILLCAGGILQGGQYVLAPRRALENATYFNLKALGENFWIALGLVLLISCACLAFGDSLGKPKLKLVAHATSGFIYGILVLAAVSHLYSPGILIVLFGLHLREISQNALENKRKRLRNG